MCSKNTSITKNTTNNIVNRRQVFQVVAKISTIMNDSFLLEANLISITYIYIVSIIINVLKCNYLKLYHFFLEITFVDFIFYLNE